MFNLGKKLKKVDVLIIIFVVIISIFIFFLFSSKNGNVVEVLVSGELYGSYSLYDDNEIIIVTKKGKMNLCIKNGEAYVTSSDCSDLDCMLQGHISGFGKSIICLPMETVIKIGEEKYEIAY